MGQSVVELTDVSKAYKVYKNRRHRAVEMLLPGAPVLHADFWALRDITLRIDAGETLGLVGVNGSGKSTLLQIIAGIVRPTSGSAVVHGRVSSLLELGAGFHPELTGRENVEMFGTVIGLSLDEIRRRFPDIERFAGIGEFVDQPVKVYSSGMFVRLAFAAAIHVDPEILLVDEALAVGDVIFQHQCVQRIRQMHARGTTILFVSHDMGVVKSLCSRVVLLDAGRIVAQGNPAEMASLYFARTSVAIAKAQAPDGPAPVIAADGDTVRFQADADLDARVRAFRHGTGAAQIRRLELIDTAGHSVTEVVFNEEVLLRVHAEYLADVPSCIIGFGFKDRTGTEVVGTNTYEEGIELPARSAGSALVVDFRLRLPLKPGTYSISSAIAPDRFSRAYFDWIDNALVVTVTPAASAKGIHGQVWIPVDIAVHPS